MTPPADTIIASISSLLEYTASSGSMNFTSPNSGDADFYYRSLEVAKSKWCVFMKLLSTDTAY